MDEDVQDLWNLSIKLLSGKRFNIWHTQSSSVVHVNAMSLLWWVKSRLSFFWRRCWNFTIADSACGITLFIQVSEWNKYSTSIATQSFYQHTSYTAVYEKNVCYNHTTKYTDWCPIPNDSGWGICLRLWKPVKETA